jgi:hypothetical protein
MDIFSVYMVVVLAYKAWLRNRLHCSLRTWGWTDIDLPGFLVMWRIPRTRGGRPSDLVSKPIADGVFPTRVGVDLNL